MLKKIRSSKELTLKKFKADNNKIVDDGSSKVNETVKNSSRKLMRLPNIRTTGKPNFLTPNAKKAFNYLWLAFIKALIFQHFDLKSHIWIKIDISGYAISKVLS